MAAFVAETVLGATAGCVPAVPGYSRRFPEISYRYRMLLVLDKIIGRQRHRRGFAATTRARVWFGPTEIRVRLALQWFRSAATRTKRLSASYSHHPFEVAAMANAMEWVGLSR